MLKLASQYLTATIKFKGLVCVGALTAVKKVSSVERQQTVQMMESQTLITFYLLCLLFSL